MTLPNFTVADDPGPNFMGLLDRLGHTAFPKDFPDSFQEKDILHGTTVVAARFSDGVVIAGDRRATSGNLISYRNMKKIFSADKWSGVAIAGAAGPAIEMVKFFQLQLEHYEKVEGRSLSLEGKANQLSQMLKANLPAAMQGFVVVPIFAGYDVRRSCGRLFAYDVTGGRYEEEEYVVSGSGSMFAKTAIKLGYSDSLSENDTVALLIKALFTAADDDSATGGPDAIRGIYPLVSVITKDGYRELSEETIGEHFESIIGSFTQGRTSTGGSK